MSETITPEPVVAAYIDGDRLVLVGGPRYREHALEVPLGVLTQQGATVRSELQRALGAGETTRAAAPAAGPDLNLNVTLSLDGLRSTGTDRRSITVKRDASGAMIGADVVGENESTFTEP